MSGTLLATAPRRRTLPAAPPAAETATAPEGPAGAQPHLYLNIGIAWLTALIWFHPRLVSLLNLAESPLAWIALLFFIVFIELAWLYGLYNVGVIIAAAVYRARHRNSGPPPALPETPPAVAILYTTYNDFVEASAESCITQNYPEFRVYLLDDSTDSAYQARVDAFAARYPAHVTVVRRPDRAGFKAGNLNHAMAAVATREPVFALVDADEILPPDFLRRTVAHLMADPKRGFVQANHRSNPRAQGALERALGIGIDIHWRWYQPLRNRYGFVMLLGHGAVVRRQAWEEVGGFPHLVSEDLAFAVRLREQGWRGYFAEDVVCYEEFPPSVRAFRVRHMKWTRGTSEFLCKELGRLLRARRISLVEKLDVLFPTIGLPFSLFWFLYLVDANLLVGFLFGDARPITLAVRSWEVVLPGWGLSPAFSVIYSPDFVFITLLTLISPILCFIVELAPRPRELVRFLGKSTTVYASLGPLSFLGVLSYVFTGRATFLVTGDTSTRISRATGVREAIRGLVTNTHPDHRTVQLFEIATGAVFAVASVVLFQPATLGLAIAFLLLPLMHHVSWERPVVQMLVYLPFVLIVSGIVLGGLGVFGVQTVFFGYGFHF